VVLAPAPRRSFRVAKADVRPASEAVRPSEVAPEPEPPGPTTIVGWLVAGRGQTQGDLWQAVRFGPAQAIAPLIEMRPKQLTQRRGGSTPLVLAVLSGEERHVTIVLEAMKRQGLTAPRYLDAADTDGRTALSAAIDLDGQQQALALLKAGASPLLSIPKALAGWRKWLLGHRGFRAKNAAEYAVQQLRPRMLSVLLEWDEHVAPHPGIYHFNVSKLQSLAQELGHQHDRVAMYEVLETSAHRRRRR